MGNRITTGITRMPEAGCNACHGLGSVRMTIHFYTGDQEWEAPCWECFGNGNRITFPKPHKTDN